MNHLQSALIRIACVTLFGIGVAACPPVTSQNPVGSTLAATAPDPALTGAWKGRVGKSDAFSYFTFFPQDDGTVTAVVVTPPSANEKGGYGAFTLKTVELGPYHYANARQTIDDGKPATGTMADNTFPVLYRVNGDGALVLYIIDEDAAKKAVKAGKIAGTIEEGPYGDVVLTATAADLDAYMASPAGRALFVKPLVILRKEK